MLEKSSVIESYKNKHRELNFVHISLAHFTNPDEEEMNIVRESVLEGKILNQLIHQISVEKIPQTNFRVKKETSKKEIILMTAILSLLLGSVTYLLLFGTMSSFVGNLSDGIIKDLLSVFTGNYTAIIVAAIAVISSITCIYNLIKIQINKNLFHRISIQGNEIDDMRVLKNVYNEFVVYMHRLDNTDLNWNKMLAMIVYKNLFSRDFGNLQLAKGYVHELFEQKDKLAIEIINKLRESEKEIQEIINRINEETLVDEQEIDDAYAAKFERLPRRPYSSYQLSEEGEKQKNKLELEKKERKRGIEINKEGRLPEFEEKLTKTQYEISVTKTN
ncbi:MAG: hypothetical protein ACI4F1_11035 [Bariatricus sp.]